MKKILKKMTLSFLLILSVAVIYNFGYRTVFSVLSNRLIGQEKKIDLSDTGMGITWIHDSADQTLFFIPSSEESAVEELYGSWLRELHSVQGINIIVPPLKGGINKPSLDSPPFLPEERSRDVIFLFNMYSRMADAKHKITVLSTGDGSLQALELAKAGAGVDKYILISPVHDDKTNRGVGVLQKISSLPFFHFLLPWLPYSFGKNRIAPYDILNDELNNNFSEDPARFYPEFSNEKSAFNIKREAEVLSRELDQIIPNRFFILYGDDDLSYSLEGFERMGDALKDGGSEVTIMRISSSGRMLLFDNGKDRILDLLSILLQ